MKCINEFTGYIIRKSGTVPNVGNRFFVEFRKGTSCREDFIIRDFEGFVGYPDENSCCKLYEYYTDGKNVTAEILSIKKEGTYCALFVVN